MNTKTTIKINSYTTKNYVLSDDKIIFGNSDIQTYSNEPIIDCADDLLNAIYAEKNGKFDLEVQENLFERTFLEFKSREFVENGGFTTCKPSISLSTQTRFEILIKNLMLTPLPVKKINVSVVSTGTTIKLPDYSHIKLCKGDESHTIYVSNNKKDIYPKLSSTEEMTFLIGGETEQRNGNYIIGCTDENVNEMVQSYIETKYINRLINDFFEQFINKPVAADSKQPQFTKDIYLVNRIEPFYKLSSDVNINAFVGDNQNLNVSCLSCDEQGNLIINNVKDFNKLTITETRDKKDLVNIEINDNLSITPSKSGNYTLSFFLNDRNPLFVLNINVKNHNYANSISFEVPKFENWRTNICYNVNLYVRPENAEDKNEIIFESSAPDVAEVSNGKLHVYKEGYFTITAKAKQTSISNSYCVEKGVVEEIKIPNWPYKNKTYTNNSHTIYPEILPYESNHQGYRLKAIKGGNKVSFRTDRNRLTSTEIHTLKPGKAVIRVISEDSPEVFVDKTLKIRRQFVESYSLQKLGGAMLGITAIFMLFRSSWVFSLSLIALLFFVLAMLRKEDFAKTTTVLALCALIVIGILRINVFYTRGYYENAEQIPNSVIANMKEIAEEDIYGTVIDDWDIHDWDSQDEVFYAISNYKNIGYFYCGNSKLNIIKLVYKFNTTSKATHKPHTFYAMYCFERLCFNTYNPDKKTFKHKKQYFEIYSSFDALYSEEVLSFNGSTVYSNISNKTICNLLGINRYVLKKKSFSKDQLNNIISKGLLELNNKYEQRDTFSKIKHVSTKFTVAPTIHTKDVNSLTFKFSQIEYKNGKKLHTYNYFLNFYNIQFDSNGTPILNYEDGRLSETVE